MAFGVDVDFNANVAKFSKSVDKINGDLGKFRKSIDRSAAQSSKAFNAMASGAKVAGAAFAVAFSAKKIANGFKSVVDEQQNLQRNLLRTEALLRSTGAAAGLSAGRLHEQARELALATLQSTDGVLKAQQVLLTFKSVTDDTFTRAIELANDLAVTTGTSLNSAVTQLGKALQDPVKGMNAMTRSGVSFSAQSQEIIKNFVKTNQLAEAQKVILDELAGQYGGIAKNEAVGFAGSVDTMGQSLEEFKIHLGDNNGVMEAFAKSVSFITASVRFLDDEINGFNSGIVDSKLNEVSNKILVAKEELSRLTTKASTTGGRNGNRLVNEKIIAQEKLISALMKERLGIAGELTSKRAEFNAMALQTRLDGLANDFTSDIYSSSPDNPKANKKSPVAIQTAQAFDDMTGPASVWNEMMRQAAVVTEQARSPLENLNRAIEEYSELANHGLISQETFNSALVQAGEDYNALTDTVGIAVGEMDQFAIQAARNMQDSFADFLFDPFNDGLEGMLKGFSDVIRRMIAEQASAQIFGKDGLNVGGLFNDAVSGAGSFIGGLFHDGGLVGSGGSSIAVNPAVFAGAPRFHGGGFPGLRPDEVPAILQKGELVLSRKQVSNSLSGVNGGDNININMTFNSSGGQEGKLKAAQLGKILQATIKQKLIEEKRPGGILA